VAEDGAGGLDAVARRWWIDVALPGGDAAAVPIAGLVEAIESAMPAEDPQ